VSAAPLHSPADRLRGSLILLFAVLSIALVGLATEGNWPKLLRVAGAGCAYATTLLVVRRRGASADRWFPFAVAGSCAGITSGLLRLDPGAAPVVIDAAAATLLATVHWIGLGLSERVRSAVGSRTMENPGSHGPAPGIAVDGVYDGD
jgi:hypothetical protein